MIFLSLKINNNSDGGKMQKKSFVLCIVNRKIFAQDGVNLILNIFLHAFCSVFKREFKQIVKLSFYACAYEFL